MVNAPQLPTVLSQPLEPASASDLHSQNPSCEENLDEVRSGKVCSRTRSLLAHLRLPGLLRAERLRADIRALTGISKLKVEEQLDAVARNGNLAEFIAHITQSVEANPHVLLAYAWVLYMALFSGGRYLRASLKEAGGVSEFWHRDSSPVRPYSITQELAIPRRNSNSEVTAEVTSVRRPRSRTRSDSVASRMIPGLSFFNFIGAEDGEDIKLDFKKRIAEAEVLLTEGEKEDIIQEAQDIFRFMVEMVEELDRVMGTTEEEIESVACRQRTIFKKQRDSVAIHKGRMTNKSSACPAPMEPPEIPRRPSYLEVFVTNPVTAKIVHFNDNWEAIIHPLQRRLTDKVSPRVSLDSTHGQIEGVRVLVVRAVITFLPIFALGAVFMAWRYMEEETRELKARLESYL